MKCGFSSAPVIASYTIRDGVILLLLLGGDKSSQEKDIRMAKKIAGSP